VCNRVKFSLRPRVGGAADRLPVANKVQGVLSLISDDQPGPRINGVESDDSTSAVPKPGKSDDEPALTDAGIVVFFWVPS